MGLHPGEHGVHVRLGELFVERGHHASDGRSTVPDRVAQRREGMVPSVAGPVQGRRGEVAVGPPLPPVFCPFGIVAVAFCAMEVKKGTALLDLLGGVPSHIHRKAGRQGSIGPPAREMRLRILTSHDEHGWKT